MIKSNRKEKNLPIFSLSLSTCICIQWYIHTHINTYIQLWKERDPPSSVRSIPAELTKRDRLFTQREDFFVAVVIFSFSLFSSPFSFCPHYDCGESPFTRNGLAFNSDSAGIFFKRHRQTFGLDFLPSLLPMKSDMTTRSLSTGDRFSFDFQFVCVFRWSPPGVAPSINPFSRHIA